MKFQKKKLKPFQSIFAKAAWNVAVGNGVTFYVDKCVVKMGVNNVNIVDQNCYSKTFNAKLLNTNFVHQQPIESKLSFSSFSMSSSSTSQVFLKYQRSPDQLYYPKEFFYHFIYIFLSNE